MVSQAEKDILYQIGKKCGTYKHLEGVEREFDTADGRGQIWLHVGVLATLTILSLVADSLGQDTQVDAKLDRLSIFVSGKNEGVIVTELESGTRRHLFLKERVIILLTQGDLLLCEANIFKNLVKVEGPLANVIVRLEEIKVPSLHH